MKLGFLLGSTILLTLPAAAVAQAPTDPQITAIVVAANNTDIDAGKLALKHATNKDVRAFAQQMVTDHSAVNAAATKLVTKLHVTPEANATSKELTAGGVAARAKLTAAPKAGFDKAYIDNEVAYHQAVIDAIDKTLIPSAQNAELKTLLVQSRPAFVAHLDHAKQIQASLQ